MVLGFKIYIFIFHLLIVAEPTECNNSNIRSDIWVIQNFTRFAHIKQKSSGNCWWKT